MVSTSEEGPGRGATAGTWPWLARLVSETAENAADPEAEDPGPDETWVCAGPAADDASGLVRSREGADELAALRSRATVSGAVVTAEDCWATVTTARAVAAVGDPDRFFGPLRALRAHDEERHTAYLSSLAAWLDHPGEPTAAARALGVHVNTLRYRMVRMCEVVPIPLDDPTARLALRLQLMALGHSPG